MANVVANIVVNAQVMGAVRNLTVLQKSLNDINKAAVFSPAALKAQQAWTAAAAQGAVASGQFSARMVPVVDQVGRFNTALERGTMGLGQYAKYTAAAAASQTRFRNIFRDTNLITKVAEANVRQLGTQYSLLGKSATGANQALALTPRYLNSMSAATQVAIEKQRIMHQLFRQGNAALLNWGKNTQWAGRQLMVGFTLPLTIFAGVAAKTFRDLEKQAINFRKVYGDIFTTRSEVEENLSAVKDLAKEYTRFGVAVKDTMELAAIAAQAGQRGAQLQSATEEATRLSVLGQMDSQDAMRATIALQSAFGLSSDKLTESINFMNMVNNSTVLSLQDMAEAIPRVAPVIRGLGGDVREMAVLLTAMREGGVSAAEAANGLKSSLGRLIAPSKQAREVAKAFGISLEEIVQVNRGDLLGTITDLSKAMEKLQDLEKQQLLSAVFGKFQFARMGALFSNITREGSQAQVVMERLGMSAQELAGIAEKELGAIEESASTKFTAALEQLKLSIVPIGEAFLKAITPIAEFFTKIMNFFDGLGAGTKNTIMMGVALVAIIGPITMLVGLFANAVSQILNFGRIMLKFRAILMGNGAAWRTYTSAEREAIASNASLGSTTESVTAKMLLNKQAADVLAVTYNKLAGAAIGAANAVARIPGAGGAAARAGGAAAGRFNKGGDVEAEKAFATKSIFASGGDTIVPGIGNKDTVPAVLTPGEFVVNKQSTEEYRPILELINNGQFVALNSGGYLDPYKGGNRVINSFQKPRVSIGPYERQPLRRLARQKPQSLFDYAVPKADRFARDKKPLPALPEPKINYQIGNLQGMKVTSPIGKPMGSQYRYAEVPAFGIPVLDKMRNETGLGKYRLQEAPPEVLFDKWGRKISREEYNKRQTFRNFLGMTTSARERESMKSSENQRRNRYIQEEAVPKFGLDAATRKRPPLAEGQSTGVDDPNLPSFLQPKPKWMAPGTSPTTSRQGSSRRSEMMRQDSLSGRMAQVPVLDTRTDSEKIKSLQVLPGQTIDLGNGQTYTNNGRQVAYVPNPKYVNFTEGQTKFVQKTGFRKRPYRDYPSPGFDDLGNPVPQNIDLQKSVKNADIARLAQIGVPWALEYMKNAKVPGFFDPVVRNFGGTIPPTRPAQLSVARFNKGDSVPAMLTPGEFVVNRDAAQSNMDILEAINSGGNVMRMSMGGKIPRYARGGKSEFLHMDEPRKATEEEIKAAKKYSKDARVIAALNAGKTPNMYSNLGIMGPGSFNDAATGKQMASLFKKSKIEKTMMPFYRAYAQAVAGSGVTVTKDMFKEALKDPKAQQSIRALGTSLGAAYGAQGGASLTPQQQGQILKDVVQNQAKTDQTLGKMLPFMMTRATMGVPDPSAPGGTHRASFPVQAQRSVGSSSAVPSYRSWSGSDRLGGPEKLDKETKQGKKAQKEQTKAVQDNTKETKKQLKEQKKAKKEMRKTANDILKKHGNTPAGRAAMVAAFPTTSANVLDRALAKAELRGARKDALSRPAQGERISRGAVSYNPLNNPRGLGVGPSRTFSQSSPLGLPSAGGARTPTGGLLAIESRQARDARLRAEEARMKRQQSGPKITDRRGGPRALSSPVVNLAETPYDRRLRENSQNMQRTAQTMAMRASAASIASSEALSKNATQQRTAIQEMTRQSQRPSVARFGAAPEGAGAFRRGFARLTRPIRSGIDSGLGAMQRSAYGVAPGTGWDARRGAIQNVGVNPYSGGTMMAASQMFRQSGMQILRNQVEGVSKSFSNLSNGMKGFGRGIKTVGQLLMPGATSWARFDKGAGPLFFGGGGGMGGMGGGGGGGGGFIGPRLPDGSTTTKSAPTFFRGGYVGDEKQGSKLTRGIQKGGGMAGMAMMMGSMLPMMNQDKEGKFMGIPAAGAMMGMMGGGMLLSMVSGMGGPAIAAVLGLGSAAAIAGVAIYKWRDGLDSSARAAADLGANLGVTANAATKMAKVLQTSTPAQRKTDLQLGLVGEAREEAFGEFGQFLETEVGQSFIKGLEEAASPERFKMLSDYLRTAVATGLMDSQQAQSFAKVVASSIGDAFLGIRVASQLGNQKTGFSAMQALAEERLAAVSQSAALGAIRTGETVTIEQAGEGIGASLQVIGDFSNVIAMAREDYQNGIISFNDMTAAVDNARKVQSEYNKILSASLSQGDDRGAVRQALKDQLVASGLLNPEEFEAAESSIKNIASEQAKRRVGESSSAVTLGAMSLGFDLLKAGPFGIGGEIIQRTLPFPGKEGLTGSAALDPREIAAESMSKRIEDDLKALYVSMIQDGMNKADALAIAQAVGEDDKLAEIYQKLLEQQLGPIEAAATSMSLRGRMFEGQEAAAADRRGSAEYVSSQLAQKYVLQGRGNIADFQAFEAALPEGRELEILQSVAKLTTEKFKQYVSDFMQLNAILGDADTAALVSESQAYRDALDQGRGKEFLSNISSAKEEFGQDFESVYNFIIKSNVPDPEAKLNELTEVAGRFKREVPPVITTTLGIEVTGEGVGASMDEWGPFIDGILTLAPAIEALPEGIQEFGARFIMDMSSGEKKIADPKTFLKNLQNVKDTFEKMKTSKTEVKKTLAFQLIQTMENQDGTPITRAQFDEAYASLVDRLGEGVVKNLPPDVYTKVLALEIDASQLEEQASGLEEAAANLSKIPGLEAMVSQMKEQAAALRSAAASIRASATGIALAADAGGGPTKPPGGGGSSGGGDKQKNFIEELRDRVKELAKVNKFITRVIAGNAPSFKNFVAGPFAPEFLQFLEQQGEEAVKLLGKNAKKFKKVYNDFIKEQAISNSIALKIQRQFNKKEVKLSNERQNFLSGFTGTTAERESIMSRMGEEDFKRFLEYRTMTQKERKKLGVEDNFQQLQKTYDQLARQAPKLAANDQLEAFRDNITASKEEVQTLRALMARGFSATFAQQLMESGVGLELLTKGTAKAREELARLIADARKLNIDKADMQIDVNYDTQSQEIEKTYSILKLIPGANQNIIQGIIGMGIAAGSLPSQIMKAANAFSMLQARANLVRDAFSKNSSLIEAAVSGFQAQIEKINRVEIRPIELSIKAIESGVREFEKQVRSLQKTIRPLEKEVKEFEKQIKPLEKQIKAYDKQIRELQKTIRPLEKENEALQEVEKEITEEFEKREKSLDKIEKINSRIAAQQRAQLSMAQAIAEGDIYAVAAAMQQYRAEQAQMNAEQTRDALKEGFENRREEITKKIEENEKRIKVTNEQIEGIQERIEAIQENIESIQERIEERQERIAEINENIADIQERIADEQDRIRDLQEQIEASKERQLALEEKIYKLQLLRSMLDTASQIRDAVAAGDPELAQILQGQLGAQRDVASGMDFSDLGINTEGIFNLVAQAINPERIAEAVKTQITAGLLNILDSMGVVANNWVATGTTHMAEMERIFGEMSRMSQEELSKFSPGMQAFLQAIKDKTIEFPKTAEELQAALIAYGVKGSDMVQLLMAAEGLGIIKKVDETGENATTNVEGAERRGKKNIDKEAEAIGKSAANLGKKVADAEREFEKGNITFRQAALRILGAMAEAIGSAAIAKVDTGGFNNALKTISTALQTTITEFSSTLSGTLDVILLIGNKFKDNVAAIEGISDDFSGIMEKVSEGFDNILTNVSNEFGVIGADFNAKFQGLMSSLVDAFGESIKTEFGRIVTALQTFTNESDGLPFILRGILTALSGFTTAVSNAVGILSEFTRVATDEITRVKLLAIGEIQNQERISVSNITKEAERLTPRYAGGMIKAYAMGGKIKGYPMGGKIPYAIGGVAGDGGRDSVPAILTPGEFVVRKSMVKKYGQPLFESINQGSFAMPRYNMPESRPTNIQTVVSTTSINAPVYNTYDMDFAINGTNASADEIANKVMFKMRQVQNQGIRSNRGY